LDPRQGYVFMANHQSLFDIPVLIQTLPGQTRFLAKKSLFRIPIFGWAIAAGDFVPVDRKNRASARQTFDAAIDRLEKGNSILLFPEETRSLGGELLPFKRGGFLMALKSGFPIVPVTIRGTLAVRSRKTFLIRPGQVEVIYGVPIEASAFGIRGREELSAEVRSRIEEQLNRCG
jgi:1-acyl-sn-glycerol-3-phosphate acyltransferase